MDGRPRSTSRRSLASSSKFARHHLRPRLPEVQKWEEDRGPRHQKPVRALRDGPRDRATWRRSRTRCRSSRSCSRWERLGTTDKKVRPHVDLPTRSRSTPPSPTPGLIIAAKFGFDVTPAPPTPDYVLDSRHTDAAKSMANVTVTHDIRAAYGVDGRRLREELGRAPVLRQIGIRRSPSRDAHTSFIIDEKKMSLTTMGSPIVSRPSQREGDGRGRQRSALARHRTGRQPSPRSKSRHETPRRSSGLSPGRPELEEFRMTNKDKETVGRHRPAPREHR